MFGIVGFLEFSCVSAIKRGKGEKQGRGGDTANVLTSQKNPLLKSNKAGSRQELVPADPQAGGAEGRALQHSTVDRPEYGSCLCVPAAVAMAVRAQLPALSGLFLQLKGTAEITGNVAS